MDELKKPLDLVADGTLKPFIGNKFSLEKSAETQKMMAEYRQICKIVLKP